MSNEDWNFVDNNGAEFQVNNETNSSFTELVTEMDNTIQNLQNDENTNTKIADDKKESVIDFTSLQRKLDDSSRSFIKHVGTVCKKTQRTFNESTRSFIKQVDKSTKPFIKHVGTFWQQSNSRFIMKHFLAFFLIISLLTLLKGLLESWVETVVQKSMSGIVEQHHSMNKTQEEMVQLLANVVEENQKLSLEIKSNVNPTYLSKTVGEMFLTLPPMINSAEKRVGEMLVHLSPMINSAEKRVGELFLTLSPMINSAEKRVGEMLVNLSPMINSVEKRVEEMLVNVSKYPIFTNVEKNIRRVCL